MLLKYYSTASEEEIYEKLAKDLLPAEQLSKKLSEDLAAFSKYLAASFVDKDEATRITKGLMDNITDIYSCMEVVAEATEFLSGTKKQEPTEKPPEGLLDTKSPELLLGQLTQLQDVRSKLQESLKNFQVDEKKDLDTDK